MGGALASQSNIDHGLNSYFLGSGIRLQRLSFQDDIASMVKDIGSAQAGNVKNRYMLKEQYLEVHLDITGFIVMGGKAYKKQVLAIIPSLLNNSCVWTEIDEKTVLVN